MLSTPTPLLNLMDYLNTQTSSLNTRQKSGHPERQSTILDRLVLLIIRERIWTEIHLLHWRFQLKWCSEFWHTGKLRDGGIFLCSVLSYFVCNTSNCVTVRPVRDHLALKMNITFFMGNEVLNILSFNNFFEKRNIFADSGEKILGGHDHFLEGFN